MANTAINCELKTDAIKEPCTSYDSGLLDPSDLKIDCSLLSSHDFIDFDMDFGESTWPSPSETETLNVDSITIDDIDIILNKEASNSLQIKHHKKNAIPVNKKNMMKKGRRYLPSFKRKVLNYAVKHSFKETARKFDLNCNTITEWAREYKRLLLLKKSTTTRPDISIKTDESGNLIKTDQTDSQTQRLMEFKSDIEFLQWLKKNRMQGCRIGRRELQNKGLNILQSNRNTSEWFRTWINRLMEMGDEKNIPTAGKHIYFPPSFKLEVALYGDSYTKSEAASTFGVSSRRVYEWCEIFDKPKRPSTATEVKKALVIGDNEHNNYTDTKNLAITPGNEDEFLQWLKEKRQGGYRVERNELQAIGLSIVQGNSNTTAWFTAWVSRLVEMGREKALSGSHKLDKYISYSAAFKSEVALFGEIYSKPEAARTFGVSSRRVYDWCESIDKPKNKKVLAKSLVERKLWQWYHQRRLDGNRPKSIEIMSKARELYVEGGLPYIKCSQGWLDNILKRLDIKLSHADDDELLLWVLIQLDNNCSLTVSQVTNKTRELAVSNGNKHFKGSKGKTLRFLKRNSHLLQSSSVKLSDLPPTAALNAQSFCVSTQQRIGAAALAPDSIGCMDEVPIYFVYPTDVVPTPRLLRKVNLEEARCVVLLAATSDGQLLPPAVVLVGPHAIQTFRSGKTDVVVLRHDSGAIDQQILIEWARHVWFPSVRAPSVLVVDSFTPHSHKGLEEVLAAGYCHLAVIPPGCAVHLHPCAFDLTRRFQEVIQEEWLKYTAALSVSMRQSKVGPNDDDILNWVARAYRVVKKDSYSVKCSFNLTGLTKPDANNSSAHVQD